MSSTEAVVSFGQMCSPEITEKLHQYLEGFCKPQELAEVPWYPLGEIPIWNNKPSSRHCIHLKGVLDYYNGGKSSGNKVVDIWSHYRTNQVVCHSTVFTFTWCSCSTRCSFVRLHMLGCVFLFYGPRCYIKSDSNEDEIL